MQSPITDGTVKSISEQFSDYTDEEFTEVENKFDWDIPYIIKSTSTGEERWNACCDAEEFGY
jgi:hypothetical protein